MIGSDNINSIDLTHATLVLTERIVLLVEQTRSKVSAYLNSETTLMNWQIGQYIHLELKQKGEIKYGKQILATLSQQLTQKIGKGYSYSALTRMVKVAETFDEQIIATLSQQLSWSHLIELTGVENELKRNFYSTNSIKNRWNVRFLRDPIVRICNPCPQRE